MDVTAELVIDRPREVVAAYAMDPGNDPIWIGGIKHAEMLSAPPVAVGTRVRRIASFLGRRIEYVMEVVDLRPSARIEMRSIVSPFPMNVTYGFDEAPGGTRASIRVQGSAEGVYRLAAPIMERQVKRSISGDLRTLKRLMEAARSA